MLTHSPITYYECKSAVLPLGIALSVARVPLTAVRRPLVLSLAALTLPFSPSTLSAFSTNKGNNDDGYMLNLL